MRYRVLSPTGDYTFGQGPGEFLVNSPAAVAQAIGTRLRLMAMTVTKRSHCWSQVAAVVFGQLGS